MNWLERKIVEAKVMKWLKAHWGLISSLGGTALVFLTPSLASYAGSHKSTLAGLVIAALLKVAQEEKLLP